MKRNNLVRTLVSLVALVTMLCSMMSIAYAEAGGLTVIDSMELKYASGFSVDYCEGGYKIITDGIGKQFLLVPEGAEIPETDMVVLQAPLTKLGCFSTTHAVPLKALDKLDLVTMVTTKRDSWHMQQIKDQIDAGTTIYTSKKDFETISAVRPQLTFVSATTSAAPDETLVKMDEIGIVWMAHIMSEENHPLGRLEWFKLTGALLDMEEEANAFFAESEAAVEAVVAKVGEIADENKPAIVSTFIYDGTVYVRNDDDYTNKMMAMAGGVNPFEGLAPGKTGNTKMTVEDFYAGAQDVEILIYDTTSDTSVKTLSDLKAYGDYLGELDVIKEGNVWGMSANYWQCADDAAGMIEELYTIMHHPEEATDLKYYFKLEG